ncbi:tRNA 2-thiouridine(34) synthase MnmA [Patescibacteria group bacterium]|nr:tRNA 2-thiouridine(34) synthase MnmA [Patescibacteria group bacterium]
MTKHNKSKIAVGLSGGVDSSVAAFLLQKEGYDVTGVYMQCWGSDEFGCTAEEDRASAASVAGYLDIKFKYLDFIAHYKNKVIDYFFKEYEAGRTPNPDVMCNREIKFELFLKWAIEAGFDYIATGHYSRVLHSDDGYRLLKGSDASKDQSYFLYTLGQEQLSRTKFPVGALQKTEVRNIAKEAGLPTFARPDSQGICFVGEVNVKDFIRSKLGTKNGAVKSVNGDVLGEHDGYWFYTVGQRHGFRLSKYQGLPMYVISKDVKNNEIVVGSVAEATKNTFIVQDTRWSSRRGFEQLYEADIQVRLRHLGTLYPCAKIEQVAPDVFMVTLKEKVFAVAEGQSCVFYNGDEVLGGGEIRY